VTPRGTHSGSTKDILDSLEQRGERSESRWGEAGDYLVGEWSLAAGYSLDASDFGKGLFDGSAKDIFRDLQQSASCDGLDFERPELEMLAIGPG